jgi:hypothetical protein
MQRVCLGDAIASLMDATITDRDAMENLSWERH